MKIIILAFCLITAGRVQAQQKELFSIEEHLKKNKPGVISQPAPLLPVRPLTSGTVNTVLPVQPLQYTLPNGDQLYYGNGTMPCVKPDMSRLNTTINPVIGQKELPLTGPMPNGAIRD